MRWQTKVTANSKNVSGPSHLKWASFLIVLFRLGSKAYLYVIGNHDTFV